MSDERQPSWMLYGAYGTTGRLILDEALRRGHRPLLAGRDAARLAALAQQHGLATAAVSLDDAAGLRAALAKVPLVFHAVGPFAETGRPMLEACLDARVNYVDLNGEIPHLQAVLKAKERARAAGIALIGCAGFGVTFSTCVACHVAKRVADADFLRISFAPDNALKSAAVDRSVKQTVAGGGLAIENGQLVGRPLAHMTWTAMAGGRRFSFAAAPLADLVAAHDATHVANVVAGVPMPRIVAAVLRLATPLIRVIAGRDKPAAKGSPRENAAAPSSGAATTKTYRSRVWAEASKQGGGRAAALLETGEGFHMAAVAAVSAVEALLRKPLAGAFTPATAFGPDFALMLPGTGIVDLPAG
jgi:short subunit dehydrogenase-like uncharacterized protein